MPVIPWAEHNERQQAELREHWKRIEGLDLPRMRAELLQFVQEYCPSMIAPELQLPGLLADHLLAHIVAGETAAILVTDGAVESQTPRWRPFGSRAKTFTVTEKRLSSRAATLMLPPYFSFAFERVRFGKNRLDTTPSLGVLCSISSPFAAPHRAFVPLE